jgi:hypothetical protein
MSHDATLGTNLADNGVGNFALVKRVSSSFGNKSESPREVKIPDYLALLEKYTIRRKDMTPVGMFQKQRAVFWSLTIKIRLNIIPLVA